MGLQENFFLKKVSFPLKKVCLYQAALIMCMFVHQRADSAPSQSRKLSPAMQRRERGGWEGLRRRDNRKGEPNSSH